MSDENFEFEGGSAGASLTYPMEAGQVRKNGHLMMKGKPCKVVDISVSKTGKHGHAKCAFVGIDIFTGKKLEDMCPSTHNMEVPNVKRTEFQLLDYDDATGSVSVLLENGETKDDLNMPLNADKNLDETGEEIAKLFADGEAVMVTVLHAMGEEKIVACKKI